MAKRKNTKEQRAARKLKPGMDPSPAQRQAYERATFSHGNRIATGRNPGGD